MAGGPVDTSLQSHGRTGVIINNRGHGGDLRDPISGRTGRKGQGRPLSPGPVSRRPWLDVSASVSSAVFLSYF